MYWANFLHFYQPPNQQFDILEAIVNQSYRPLLQLFLQNPEAFATFNIAGCLLDLLDQNGYRDVIDTFKTLLERGQVEMTGSAKYHAFLPLLSEDEVLRQIKLQEETLKKYLGSFRRSGFFSPELAYDPKIVKIISRLGYEWIAAPQIAYGELPPQYDKTYLVRGETAKVYFRDKKTSVLILSGYAHNLESFWSNANFSQKQGYTLTIMDAETFGHHRPGLQDFLFELYQAEFRLEPVLVSHLPKSFPEIEEVTPRASTWSNEEQDFWLNREKGIHSLNPFLLWQDPANEIHQLQWEFTNWVIEKLKAQKSKVPAWPAGRKSQDEEIRWLNARGKLDKALSSDQYWWASAKPWWSLEMIEAGAYYLKEVIDILCGLNQKIPSPGTFGGIKQNAADYSPSLLLSDPDELVKTHQHSATPTASLFYRDCCELINRAENYYRRILDLAFIWQRNGYIRQRFRKGRHPSLNVPFKDRATAEEYNQFILEFEDEMRKAAANLEFEQAIKWRDAIVKLAEGTDVYDDFHIVDQLWGVRKVPSVKPLSERKPEEISEWARKYLRQP